MPILLIIGLLILILSVVLLSFWVGHLWLLVKAVAPLILLLIGVVATYFGWEEWQESRNPVMDFSSPDEEERYRREAKAMQEQINDLKDDGEA